MFTPDQSLSEIALGHPAASRVFRQHRLDFCCNGHRSVDEACRERGLDPKAVLEEIAAERAPSGLDARALPLPQLIEHILTSYHEPHRRELSDLVELARKVERVHAGKSEAPVGLAAHLLDMARTLEQHMQKEEAVLFPAILRGAGPALAMPIDVMEAEHDDHGKALERLRELAHDFTPPREACTSWKALYLRCEQLEADLMAHVNLENHVLFARALRGEL